MGFKPEKRINRVIVRSELTQLVNCQQHDSSVCLLLSRVLLRHHGCMKPDSTAGRCKSQAGLNGTEDTRLTQWEN
ncbi:hypothetical protein OJAV_G00009520 [Oryzias javanicus]|uniref:Uncharacterized protein n=1 Tax=Oryzias javanicus TaxID=123683 RepID=A0A3S2Q1V1_ORYJA|nr:hypothetical protein OJAV_G00009520 [Oryzias javanicus]